MRRPAVATSVFRVFGLGALALGCTVETASDAETAKNVTHAIVVVERSADVDASEAVKAEAFAGFLSLPAEVEPGAVLPIAELELELPAPGACRKVERDRRSAPAETLAQSELLDAGEVTLVAGGAVTTLAPRAFPSAADAISGVIYTTRDRAAEPLPAASRYTVATSGSAALEPISVELVAPAALEGVTVMGSSLAELAPLRAAEAVELRWNPGAAGDLVYVTFEGDSVSTLCAYRDDAGRGTLPASSVPSPGTATLSLHRLRATPFASSGLGRGELRFDFEVSGSVTVE
jgi:hypothetical protein